VQLSHPNGARQEVLLAGVPRSGESIRLHDSDPAGPSFIVEHIVWTDGTKESDPEVIALVKYVEKVPRV